MSLLGRFPSLSRFSSESLLQAKKSPPLNPHKTRTLCFSSLVFPVFMLTNHISPECIHLKSSVQIVAALGLFERIL